MKTSMFYPHSMGTVAAAKPLSKTDKHPLGTYNIEVTLDEIFPFVDGQVTDNTQSYRAKGTGATGRAYDVDIDTTVTVKAEWLPFGSGNRKTAPDVQIGEQVLVWRKADLDEGYYWQPWGGNEENLRRLETVIYAWSASPNGGNAGGFDPENSYWFEVSTHRGVVTFGTSKANGEPFAWNFQIDAKTGIANLLNDIGDRITIDATQALFEVENSEGTLVQGKGSDATVKAGGSVTLDAPESVVTGNLTVNGNVTIAKNLKAGGTLEVGGTGKFGGIVTAPRFIET